MVQEREKKAFEKKTEELKERMKRVHKKVGHQSMPRSTKKTIKREVTVQKVDQEMLDRQRYLGEFIGQGAEGGGK